ncbi:PREDICTED: venom peptide CtAPI [Eufriesea mexicana]|uniref:venom peptide CtAPI n=1 Tax=Eufriesea mexicana TaxID=516756 RepID=UPI00083BDD07|nr:PREDICTED: venom peptide CtAPI [Eufriesea mexicana]
MKPIATVLVAMSLCLILVPNRALVAADDTNGSGSSTETSILCGRNEEYTTCVPKCPETCENPFPEICTPDPCVQGCKCKWGYYRNSRGQCVSIVACILDIVQNQVLQLKP